ncbi:aspartyl-tRNA synthetase [Caldalkalibacillus thermarum TA2.A1]|uniref:Aspartate--tRNA ligase n=1 Tax=Caldalkalibacillus thermarum (strain TA2.A1) TaxID=986075 RepID=F5LAS1_CALTT|nr:aspartate--tRNA ligase [Caldalkalibacillus thermarum]EGL81643.1 aspartyl-tRNA synthetase [Caldalkalibacillus thermarum TA2.A1]QZT33472.1 aspartate--tRNA ligase [Caldalkalibacillus thermarum TA2.A1]
MRFKRTHGCGMLTKAHIGQEVHLSGWVNKRRDLGGLIFIDLRDRSGIVQIVFDPQHQEAFATAEKVRSEYVLAVKGRVVARDEATINRKLPTGEIEVYAEEVEVINPAKTPPFTLEDKLDVDEAVRLKYRYLDLRRPAMQRVFKLRHQAAKAIRNFLDEHGFLEIETPMLTKSTPEGARDYLVPSRVHPGEFFALPQSPQIFKQLLMVAGFERYYQIVRCFRDEDLRADRQPEFTQVDIETSFMSAQDLQTLMEEMIARLFKETIGVEVALPFERLTYEEAISRFGSDKPDLRFGLELKDVSETVKNSSFKVFSQTVKNGGQVKGINAKGCAAFSRKKIDELTEYVGRYGAKGLAWFALKEGEMRGPIAKFFTPEELEGIKQVLEAEEGDLLLFVADQKQVVAEALGALRLKLGKELGLINKEEYKFCWVTDFPLVEYDEEQGRYVALHHPFTMPREEDLELFDTNPEAMRAQAYDMVLNGYEIGGGSMRIYQREVQEKMFALLGFSAEEAKEKFGFLMEAFEYGTPPHGGIAFGFDRIVMLLAGVSNLRETIAFPKTASASCLMTGAPSAVDEKQLEELALAVTTKLKV